MTPPDKIYTSRHYKQPIDYGFFKTENTEPYTVEYIHKDALIEMLNKKLQESADRLDFHANQAYAEMIDKLNSL